MEEEFQESEVMFSESGAGDEMQSYYRRVQDEAGYKQDDDRSRRKKQGSSEPVDIPESDSVVRENGDEGFRTNEDGEEMVPPHVVMARRMESKTKMACSLYAPSGRVLKGRNLCHLRNSVLRMTGFLES